MMESKSVTGFQKTSTPTPREHLAPAVIDGKRYAIGGFAKGIGNLAANERYDPQTDSWETLQMMSTPRNGLTASEINGVIFAFVGEDSQQEFSENYCFDRNRYCELIDVSKIVQDNSNQCKKLQ